MKLPFAPPLRPGETVYSFLARIGTLIGDSNVPASLVPGRFAVRPIWPVGLISIAEACPEVAEIDAETLFWEHTPAAAYLPFIDAERREKLVYAMMDALSGEPAGIAGAKAIFSARPRTLRVCPVCIKHIAYWHVVHQLPGVVVCPHHPSVWLWETDVSTSPVYGRRGFVLAGDANVTEAPGPPSSRVRSHCAAVAQEMLSLLSRDVPMPGPELVRLWLRHVLRDRGYGTPLGKVRVSSVMHDLREWLEDGLGPLLHIPSPPRGEVAPWLLRLLSRRVQTMQPLHFVLVCTFLGTSANEALKCASEFEGDPMPRTRRMRSGISPAHLRFEQAKPMLRRLWPNRKLAVQAIGDQLGVRDITVRRWAVRLCLPFPRQGPTAKIVRPPIRRRMLPPFANRVSQHRMTWRTFLAKTPSAGVRHNRKSFALYAWLYRYDREWLMRHMPKHDRRPKIDWGRRDRIFAASVPKLVTRMLERCPPVRASKSRIIDGLPLRTLFSDDVRRRLPRTMHAIDRYQEPHGRFVPRRLRWLFDNGALSARALRNAVQKAPELRNHPVLAAIFERLHSLR